jgi:(E)-4-hydroxy-3-methylbut-2-enyl-diphosphate synthase
VRNLDEPVKVAVMGCEVNGPGEAKDADVGIAAGNGRAIIFRRGQKARVVVAADMLTALMEEVEQVIAERRESAAASV